MLFNHEAAKSTNAVWRGWNRWPDSRIADGLIEGTDSLVQAAKAKAHGYRSGRNLKQ
jgi:transposase